jgi:hypothetical protein
MAILGGSPLGLINVRSTATPQNRSTFNDGNRKNIYVKGYNAGEYNAAFRGNSLFSGDRVVRAWPGISAFSTALPGVGDVDYAGLKSGTASKDTNAQGLYKMRKTLHNNDVYDISVLNIIEHLAGTAGSLKMADFAYLKDLGVFPNNRLMIARRFGGPIGDNVIAPKSRDTKGRINEYGPLATLISWLPVESDFLNITFGEKWTDAEADFKDLLNRIGGDIQARGSSSAGAIMESVGNAIPLPGFTEIFQRKFLEKMGIFDEGAGSTIPSGNPNLIKEAKRRTTIGYETAGSGLSCAVEIQMDCEYELKFISGIDPTIVWMDILGMILRFGTSPSDTYGLGKNLGGKVAGWLKNPYALVIEVVGKLHSALSDLANTLSTEIEAAFDKGHDLIYGTAEENAEKAKLKDDPDALTAYETKKQEENEQKALEVAQEAGKKFVKFITNFIATALSGLAKKYRVEIMGIVNALSGLPSTPWHITVGNPLRPVFCAGDMYTTSVKITLGPNLAFNDLPSSIKVSFALANARPWGLQEIMAKFNSGYLRTVDVQKSFYETGKNEQIGVFPFELKLPDPDPVISGSVSNPGLSGSNINTTGLTPSNPSSAGLTPSNAGLTPSTPTGLTPSTVEKTPEQLAALAAKTKAEGDKMAKKK